nr:ERAP1-like C-terminal domain-containing protein [Euzebyales bacterium]
SCLTAAGVAGEEAVAAELDRDPTDLGARRAASARAAQPLAEAKARAWTALTEDLRLPLATVKALLGGFWQPGQEVLLEPYVGRYATVLPGVWASRSPDEALVLTSGLYPSTLVSHAVVAAADAALDAEGVPGPGRRIVAEQRDGTLRALRARVADRAAAHS